MYHLKKNPDGNFVLLVRACYMYVIEYRLANQIQP